MSYIVLSWPEVHLLHFLADGTRDHPAVGWGTLVAQHAAVVARGLGVRMRVVCVHAEQQLLVTTQQASRLTEIPAITDRSG